MSKYDDIIDIKYVKQNKKPMSLIDRAAQFSPFMALSGFNETINETKRETDEFIELTEDETIDLNNKFQDIIGKSIIIEYFKPDNKKQGGKYLNVSGVVRSIDYQNRLIILRNKIAINIDLIKSIKIVN